MTQLTKVPMECRPERCANCPYGGTTVGSRGPEDSPFVIVGESPGSNELLYGYPFVGDSGELLDATLEKVGLTPDDPQPYIINAMQCFPKDKQDQSKFQSATRSCQNRLWEEIAKHPRKVILALGNAASWATTNNFGLKITQERGKLFPTDLAEIGVVVAVHPAYLMRNGTAYGAWKRDLCYAVALLKGEDPKAGLWSPPLWTTIQDRDQYEVLVGRMERAKHIAADIETGGKDKYGFPSGLHFQKGYMCFIGIAADIDNGRMVYIIPEGIFWDNLDLSRKLLGNKAKWIWQNGKFDIKFLRYEGCVEARVDEDTMLLSYTLNENKGHDLDTIAWDWIGAPQHKDAISKWFEAKGVARKNRDYGQIWREDPEYLIRYAAFDISKTYKMFFPLREAVDMDKHSKKLYERVLIPASEFLTQMEMKGMKLDEQRVKDNDLYLYEKLAEVEKKIQPYAIQYLGREINIGSPPQLQTLLWDKMKLGASGSSTDEDHLIKAQRRHDHDILRYLMQWRTIAKARNTYVRKALGGYDAKGRLASPPWTGPDGRVHITFKLHGTSTGRLSSGDPTNLQNWPRDPNIRGQFVAEEGKVFIECDLNQAELRCLALMSGDPTLIDIYTKNEVSIHHITSVAMFGENYTDDEKMRAKAVNFGIVYGRTPPSLAEEFDISLAEATEYIRIWLARFPVAAQFIQSCRDAPTQMRMMITNFGRKKRWGVISYDNQRNSENEAANFPHQSSAHDVTLLAGIECQPVVRKIWESEFVNEIHDAIYQEAWQDPNIVGPIIAYTQSVMQRIPTEWGLTRVPFLAEAKVGVRWGGRKNAKDAGITDPVLLDQYMSDFVPTDDHREIARKLLRDNNVRVTF